MCTVLHSLYMHITQCAVTGRLVIILRTNQYIQRKGCTGRQYFMVLVYYGLQVHIINEHHIDLLPMNKVL